MQWLVRYLAGREGADDLVHDAFLLALRHLHTLHDGERFGPWLMQIARNRCRKWLADRAAGPEPVTEVEELHEALAAHLSWVPNAPPGEDAELRLDLAVILRDLPEMYRLPLFLHYGADLGLVQIAAATGCPLSTVKWRLHRALEMCRLKALQRGWRNLREKRGEME